MKSSHYRAFMKKLMFCRTNALKSISRTGFLSSFTVYKGALSSFQNSLQGEESSLEASLRVEIAADYPLHCPAVSVQAFFLQREEKSALIKELEDMFSSGEPIVFEWAEKVRGKRSKRLTLQPFSKFIKKK